LYSHAELGQIADLNNVKMNETNLWKTLHTAKDLYKNDTGVLVNLPLFKKSLEINTENSLDLCKIWADMNEVD
jgi:hypothetical protein